MLKILSVLTPLHDSNIRPARKPTGLVRRNKRDCLLSRFPIPDHQRQPEDEDSNGDRPLIRKLDTRTPCENTPLKHSTHFSIAFEEDERRSPTEMLVQHKVPSEEL